LFIIMKDINIFSEKAEKALYLSALNPYEEGRDRIFYGQGRNNLYTSKN